MWGEVGTRCAECSAAEPGCVPRAPWAATRLRCSAVECRQSMETRHAPVLLVHSCDDPNSSWYACSGRLECHSQDEIAHSCIIVCTSTPSESLRARPEERMARASYLQQHQQMERRTQHHLRPPARMHRAPAGQARYLKNWRRLQVSDTLFGGTRGFQGRRAVAFTALRTGESCGAHLHSKLSCQHRSILSLSALSSWVIRGATATSAGCWGQREDMALDSPGSPNQRRQESRNDSDVPSIVTLCVLSRIHWRPYKDIQVPA